MADTTIVQADDGNLQARLLDNLKTSGANGFTITVEDDAVFDSFPSVEGLIIAGKNPTGTPNKIQRSGTGTNPPIFANLTYFLSDGAWTHLGAGVWSAATAVGALVIWAGGDGGFWNLANSLKMVSSTPDAEFEFWPVSATEVRVYTGSAVTAPPTYYSGLAMSLNRRCGVGLTNNSNLEMTGIWGIGGRTGFPIGHQSQAALGTPTQDQFDILLTDCAGGFCSGYGMPVDINSSTWQNRDIEIVRPICNGGLTASSQGGTHVLGEGLRIAGSFNNIVVTDYVAKNWRHVQLVVVQDINRNPGTVTFRAGANYGTLDCGGCNEAHSFSIEGSLSGHHLTPGFAYLSGMKCLNQATASHCSGKAVFSGFTMKQFQQVQSGVGKDLWAAAIDFTYNATIKNLDVTVEGVYIENPYGYPVQMFDSSTGATATDAIKIRHGTFVDITHRGNSTYRDGTANNASCSMRFWTWNSSTVAPNPQIVEYNNFIVSGGNGQQLISWNNTGGGSNKYTINGVSGVTASNIENIDGMVNRAQGDYRVTTLGGLYQAGTTANANSKDLVNAAFHSPASITPHQELSDPQAPPGQVVPPLRFTATGVRNRSRSRRALR